MDWSKRNSVLIAVLLLCAAGVAVEIHFLWKWREEVRRGQMQLRQRQQERDWLASQQPALSEDNAEAIAADLAAAEKQLAGVRAELHGRGGWRTKPPARSTDAFFAIASFVEQMRALAVRQQIALRPEERFGFASYANEGPDADLLPAVHEQRVVVQHLLETLFEARPRALVAIQRERPLTAAQREARRTGEASAAPSAGRTSGAAADFFSLDPRLRLNAPGLADGSGYRVEFTGQTQTLRTFLNSLQAYRLPLIVRSVEVEPLPVPASVPDAEVPAPNAPVPLVTNNLSKFAVTLECVEVLPAPTPPTS